MNGVQGPDDVAAGPGIITFPVSEAGLPPLSNLVDILSALSRQITVITGDDGYELLKGRGEVQLIGVHHMSERNMTRRIIGYLSTQLKLMMGFIKSSRRNQCWFFFLGGGSLLLPMLASRLLGRRTILILTSSPNLQSDTDRLTWITALMSNVACAVSHRIVLYAPNLAIEWNLKEFLRRKTVIAPRHFLDFERFEIMRSVSQRPLTVGYVGRFCEEKGVREFVHAIPLALRMKPELEFRVVGDGPLLGEIIEFLGSNGYFQNRVVLKPWMPHNELPMFLNELRLIVLPSKSEGLPNIILEAMACGTPVLASPVGAIPTIITDKANGFLLHTDSIEGIAGQIVSCIDDPGLPDVADSAVKTIRTEFTFQRILSRWKELLVSCN